MENTISYTTRRIKNKYSVNMHDINYQSSPPRLGSNDATMKFNRFKTAKN